MIEVARTVTIANDGSVWTLTEAEVRALRDSLNDFLGDTFTKHPPTFFETQAAGAPTA